jgi:hypothetical protein
MKQLSGNSPGKNNKSCRVFSKNPKKLGPAGGEQGRGLGSTTVRFVGLVGEEGLPTGVDSGTRRPPLEPLLRRASGRGKATGGAGSS